MKRKERTELPGLTGFFQITVGIGLFSGILSIYLAFSEYSELFKTEYALLVGAIFGINILELSLSIGMLVLIAFRKRAFLILFWIDVADRVVALLLIPFLNGNALNSFASLIISAAWAFYFYYSDNFAKAFTPYKKPVLKQKFASAEKFSHEEHLKKTEEIIAPSKDKMQPAQLQDKSPIQNDEAGSKKKEDGKEENENLIEENVNAVCSAPEQHPQKEPPNTNKRRFCKYCGTELSPANSVCPGCGKRVRIAISWRKAIFLSLFVLSLAGNVVLAVIIGEQKQQLESVKQYSYQNTANNGLSWPNLYDLNTGEKNKIGRLISFTHNYIAVVTPEGTKWHYPYCHQLADSTEFYIYSTSGAEQAGYEPCKDCSLPYIEFMEKYTN